MDYLRHKFESAILEKYFPKRYKFQNLNTPEEFLDVGLKVQSGNVYRICIKLKPDYPNSLPKAFVVYPQPLTDYNGNLLNGGSHGMHTGNTDNNRVQICHFKKDNWHPNQSLYKVIMKCRIWLEAYEAHLQTGKEIDFF